VTDGDVLKLLVATRGLQPEPVATAVLEQVLQSAAAAAAALTALVQGRCVPPCCQPPHSGGMGRSPPRLMTAAPISREPTAQSPA
jgi:hypothetical protein